MKIVTSTLICLSSLFAIPLYFTPKNLAEIRVLPKEGAEAVVMVKSGTLLEVKSSVTDTLAREWYLVAVKGSKEGGFILSADLEPVEGGDKGEALLKLKQEADTDKKRRIEAIKSHPDWPRRIKSAVRNGSVCLKMNRAQLEAAWTKPYQETRGFILGSGEVEILFFQPENPVTVVMKNDAIIGWSEKKP